MGIIIIKRWVSTGGDLFITAEKGAGRDTALEHHDSLAGEEGDEGDDRKEDKSEEVKDE